MSLKNDRITCNTGWPIVCTLRLIESNQYMHSVFITMFHENRRFQQLPPFAATSDLAWLQFASIFLLGPTFFSCSNLLASPVARVLTWPTARRSVMTQPRAVTWPGGGRCVTRQDPEWRVVFSPAHWVMSLSTAANHRACYYGSGCVSASHWVANVS